MEDYIKLISVTSIASDIQGKDINIKTGDLVKFMKKHGFDMTCIYENGAMKGKVFRKDLEKNDSSLIIRPIKIDEVVSSSMPLIDFLYKMLDGENQHYFVIDDDAISGVISEADLLKNPVKLLLYCLISAFERTLSIRLKQYNKSELEEIIYNDAVDKRVRHRNGELDTHSGIIRSLELYESLLEKNREQMFIDCIFFIDKLDYARKYGLTNLSRKQNKKINDLRNAIMHDRDYLLIGHIKLTEVLEWINNECGIN